MNNTAILNISNNKPITSTTNIKLLFYITIALSIIIFIYYAIDKPIINPITIPSDLTTDIDWKKPPCNPDDLSNDWKEVTDPNMENRREFIYKDTNIKIAFDKGIPGANRYRAVNHWHRYNPNATNRHGRYLDKDGNPTGNGKNNSHIEPKCN